MNLRFETSAPRSITTDLLVVLAHSDRVSRDVRDLRGIAPSTLARVLDSGDFTGAVKERVTLHPERPVRATRILLIGLGEYRAVTAERLRRAASTAARMARTLKTKDLTIVLPESLGDRSRTILALFEGAVLGSYRYDKHKKPSPDEGMAVETVRVASSRRADKRPGDRMAIEAGHITAGTILARDLSNAPGNELYPETLAEAARSAGDRNGFAVTVMDEPAIREAGMGGIIAVGMGSARPPRFIIMEYGPRKNRPVVLVGKGVTFDTGGISIKPSAGMAEMKMDMAGAAAVIGTFESVSRLGLPVHLVGLIPSVENMPGASAQRPGDIIRQLSGLTSEVDNTDAEGRLILADALAFAERYKPSAVIDLATLTGAVVVALGHVVTGMMGNDAALMRALTAAGTETYERVWELPLFEEYEKLIKSDVADVKNVGGRWAGAITAGWFLKKHIGRYRWAHLDIAGTAILEDNGEYTVRGGSGVGVRLLTAFLRRWK